MKNKILGILVCTLLITATSMTVAGAMNVDKNNVEIENVPQPMSNPLIWGLQFDFDVAAASGALGNAGAEYANGHFYSTRWASNLIHEYTSGGVLTRQFSVPGVSGLRDLAYCPSNGYFYGGAAGGQIFEMDFGSTPALISTISNNFQCRAIAYDDNLDVFYVSNWGDPVWIVERTTGNILGQFNLVTTTSTYGLAYDNVCNGGGPYLWVFDQGGSGADIHQWDLSIPGFTGVWHDVTTNFPAVGGIAGGLFFTTEFIANTATLGGLLQGVNDTMFCYEICEYECEPSIEVEKYVWDPVNQEWVEADTEKEAIDLEICTNATFKIVIHNNGDVDLKDIIVQDQMSDSLKFISGDPEPDNYYYEPPYYYMEWYFPGPLPPSAIIEIYITAHVEGPKGSYDFNYVLVEAEGCGQTVRDDDYAWVHEYEMARSVNRPFLSFLENHPNLFPILQLLLQRLGL